MGGVGGSTRSLPRLITRSFFSTCQRREGRRCAESCCARYATSWYMGKSRKSHSYRVTRHRDSNPQPLTLARSGEWAMLATKRWGVEGGEGDSVA